MTSITTSVPVHSNLCSSAMPWVCRRFVIVVFPDQTHLLIVVIFEGAGPLPHLWIHPCCGISWSYSLVFSSCRDKLRITCIHVWKSEIYVRTISFKLFDNLQSIHEKTQTVLARKLLNKTTYLKYSLFRNMFWNANVSRIYSSSSQTVFITLRYGSW